MTQARISNPRPTLPSERQPSPLLLPGSMPASPIRNVTEDSSTFAVLWRRHRKFAAVIFVVCIAIACLYALFAPKAYKAQTVLEIRGLNQDFMNIRDVSPTGSGLLDQTYIETQMRIIQNDSVIERVVKAMTTSDPGSLGTGRNIRESLVRKILRTAKVKEEGASNLVAITLLGPDPQFVAETTNQLAHQYIEEEQSARTNEASDTNEFLSQQLNDARAKLQISEDALQAYAKASGIVLTNDSQESVATEHLRQIQQGLSQAEVDLANRQAQIDVARTNAAESLPQVVNDPIIRQDKEKLRDLRVQLADLSTTMTPANYKVKKVQEQIRDLEEEMAHHRALIVGRLLMEQHEAARRQALLQEQYRRQFLAATDQGSKQVHYNMLRHEVDVDRQIYQSMVQKAKEAGVMAALRAPNARIVSEAVPPTSPASPKLPLCLFLATFVATVLSALHILIAERRNRSLRTPGQIEVLLPSAELAAIPRARLPHSRSTTQGMILSKMGLQRIHPMLSHWAQTDGIALTEAFRVAGTSILLRTDGGARSSVLLITSPHPQCGKTTSAANIAISLAESGRRVLVIDGDLRKAGLSRLFGYEHSAGLSETLADPWKDPRTLIKASDFPGVHVLSSGTVPENAVKLLQSDRLREVVDTVRSEFDFVLLDGPPLLGFADARLLGRYAEGVILICRAGKTQPDELNETWSLLKEDGANILGTILNDYDLKTECPSRYESYSGYSRSVS